MESNDIEEKLSALEEKLELKLKELPPALHQTVVRERGSSTDLNRVRNKFIKEFESHGYMEVACRWDTHGEFDRNISGFSVGDKLKVSVGDVNERTGVFVIYDDKNQSVGQIINYHPKLDYSGLMRALMGATKSSQFEIELLSIKEQEKFVRGEHRGTKIDFNAKTIDPKKNS